MDLNGHVVTNIYVKSEFSPKSIVAKLSDIADYVGGVMTLGLAVVFRMTMPRTEESPINIECY